MPGKRIKAEEKKDSLTMEISNLDFSVDAKLIDEFNEKIEEICREYGFSLKVSNISHLKTDGEGVSVNDIAEILNSNYSIDLTDGIYEEIRDVVNKEMSKGVRKLSAQWVYDIFSDRYLTYMPIFNVCSTHFKQNDGIFVETEISCGEKRTLIDANGNGRLDAVSNTIKQYFNISYELSSYEEKALTSGSSSKAMACVCVSCEGKCYYGVGIDEDIIKASINALVVAVNKLPILHESELVSDDRLLEIINFMQNNYREVDMGLLSEYFHLSKPYLSKYIKDKSGRTFGEHLTEIKLKKAKTLLKNGSMTVERIADSVGYPNAEHFNRVFKKKFNMTPIQYRNAAYRDYN